ncbi:MAG: dipeptide/oligopeptide/nickel ABC transporter ATP-binding protein, partial [Deltaproteobacteria bacterium]|nr:dipeptide/oligopeptide/nickel ABC transporter ATP-binding protein [Deltaproteobacteria bacterium]
MTAAAARPRALVEVKDLKVHFPLRVGRIFRRGVGTVRAVDGVDLTIQ